MIKKARYILSILLLTSMVSAGQYKSETLRKADKLYENHKIYEAVDYYIEAIKESPESQETMHRLASLYALNQAVPSAIKWYEELLKFKVQNFPMARFEYAQLLKKDGQHEKAIVTFKSFLKKYQRDDKPMVAAAVKLEVSGCEKALSSPVDSTYEVINLLAVNSIYTDMSPHIFQDTLYFSTILTDTPLTYLDDIGLKTYMHLNKIRFDAEEDSAMGPITPIIVDTSLSKNTHYANVVFSKNGELMLFTACQTDINFKNHCDIFASMKKSNRWTKPIKLGPSVNHESVSFSSTHPYLAPHKSKKKRTLYFSSNKPGGLGGYDLWSVDIDQKLACGSARNLGKKINSPGDEITPFVYSEEQILYYSSNGKAGFGGFDVYMAKKRGSRFKNVTSLGKPFNTGADEFAFQPYKKNKYVLVSNREGAATYHAHYVLDDLFIIKKKSIDKFLMVKVFVQDSLQREINDKKLRLSNTDTTFTIATNDYIKVSPEKKYSISTALEGYINDAKTTWIKGTGDDTTLVILYIQKVQKEKEIQLNNIYFDYQSAALKEISKKEIDLLYDILINNPQFRIEIGAHTDSKGTAQYNEDLSQKRAQSVVDYLLDKGIHAERLEAKGYGESKPIAPNTNEDGSDNEKGRQLNRRIAFKIIGLVATSPEFNQNSQKVNAVQDSTSEINYQVLIKSPVMMVDTAIDGVQINFTKSSSDSFIHYLSTPFSSQDSAMIFVQKLDKYGLKNAVVLADTIGRATKMQLTQNAKSITYKIPVAPSQQTDTSDNQDDKKRDDRLNVPTNESKAALTDFNDSTLTSAADSTKKVGVKSQQNKVSKVKEKLEPFKSIEGSNKLADGADSNIFTSIPIDASAVKNKVRWLKRPAAQRISCKTPITIHSMKVMAKQKSGVKFRVRVVKASNGKIITESEEFNLAPDKSASARVMKLHEVRVNIFLEKGSYFIFPVITDGLLAFLPRYTKENSFKDGLIKIHKAMYTSYDRSNPTKFKFKTKEEKKNTFVNYGPFLNIKFELAPLNK